VKRKVEIPCKGCVPEERMLENLASCKARGLPYVSQKSRPALAVVGGGHSAKRHVEELRVWSGDVWACGSVYHWLKSLGIESTLFCVDPQALLASMAVGAKKALLATSCDPSAFDVLKDADVEVFDLIRNGEGVPHGPTTGTTAFALAFAHMGYTDVSFFGFDSSYAEEADTKKPDRYDLTVHTHAYKSEAEPMMMRVVCNGRAFITCAEFFIQAQWMADMFRTEVGKRGFIKNRSGGLLAALIEDPDYDCTHVSPFMQSNTKFEEAA
jgi:hypothetical protein